MKRVRQLGIFLLFTGGALCVHAAERVTLANGFTVACSHHAEVDGRLRLFTGKDDASYIEFALNEVAGIESVPDPPAPPQAVPDPPKLPAKLTSTDIKQIVTSAGATHHLDVDLLASVIKAESGGNVRAVSRTGAQGLMQLMPGTASEQGVADSFAPEQNVGGGSAYLDSLLTRYRNNLSFALAAYNAGPGAVDRYHGIPPYRETRLYVARVIHEFNRRVLARQRAAAEARRIIASTR